MYDEETFSCPSTYSTEKDGKLDWSNIDLKTAIVKECKHMLGDAYDDQKLK